MARTSHPGAENYPEILNIVHTPPRQRVRAVRAAVVYRVDFVAVPEEEDLGGEAY